MAKQQTRSSFSLPPKVSLRLILYHMKTGRPKSHIIEEALEMYLVGEPQPTDDEVAEHVRRKLARSGRQTVPLRTEPVPAHMEL